MSSSSFDSPDQSFNSAVNSFSSAAKSSANSYSTAVIITVVVVCIGIIAIVIAIIHCMKKTRKSGPNNTPQVNILGQSNSDVESNHPNLKPLKVVTNLNSQPMEAATMERFLSDMDKEKPFRFTSELLKDFTSNYSTKLGEGAFGNVYKGWLPKGIPIAVKVLNSNLGKRGEKQFMAEISTIGRTFHINLVRLYGFCFDTNLQALVYEYMQCGSLEKLLFSDDSRISWKELHAIALGTAKGIAYLHEDCQERIIHYDIKPENVLLDSNMIPKVADFGLAKLFNRDNTHVESKMTKGGTLGYAAPEVCMLIPDPVTYKCDVYSFGMMLFEIVGRRRNSVGGDLSGTTKAWLPRLVYDKVERNEVAEMLAELGVGDQQGAEMVVMVALLCVQSQPSARPDMGRVVRMLEGVLNVPRPSNPFAYLGGFTSAAPQGGFPSAAPQGGFTSSAWPPSSFGEATNLTFPRILEKRIDVITANYATS